ncbi:MAG: HesA/MoeB/ThiF family protein [Leptospiraceae bacterium]|nr:HesA/MoeB/ThiF family protein [Leptospiraceae bacterium]
MLSSPEITRYSRNILLSEVGRKGQEKLKESIVTVVGAGGLGSPVLYYLAAAGVGEIRIIDSDKVDLTNLQRQILYNTTSLNKSKVLEAEQILTNLNSNIKIVTYNERLTASNIVKIFSGSNLILEGSDNFETKFLVNDACHFLKIPLIIAGILRFEGQVIGVIPNTTACYRCIFQSPPDAESVPNCAEAGVIGSVAGLVGSIQATESIKYLLGIDQGLFGSILSIDTKSMEFRKIQVLKNKICPLCGDNPSITQIEDIVIPHCDWV